MIFKLQITFLIDKMKLSCTQ